MLVLLSLLVDLFSPHYLLLVGGGCLRMDRLQGNFDHVSDDGDSKGDDPESVRRRSQRLRSRSRSSSFGDDHARIAIDEELESLHVILPPAKQQMSSGSMNTKDTQDTTRESMNIQDDCCEIVDNESASMSEELHLTRNGDDNEMRRSGGGDHDGIAGGGCAGRRISDQTLKVTPAAALEVTQITPFSPFTSPYGGQASGANAAAPIVVASPLSQLHTSLHGAPDLNRSVALNTHRQPPITASRTSRPPQPRPGPANGPNRTLLEPINGGPRGGPASAADPTEEIEKM